MGRPVLLKYNIHLLGKESSYTFTLVYNKLDENVCTSKMEETVRHLPIRLQLPPGW